MAAPSASFRLEGVRELQAKLSGLDRKVRADVMKKVVGAAAKPMVKNMKTNLASHKRTGLLSLSLGIKQKSYRRGATRAAIIGSRLKFKGKKAEAIRGTTAAAARAKPANYAHFLESGAKPHWIRSRGGALRFLGVITQVVRHPGIRPKKPFSRAFEGTVRRSLRIIKKELGSRIEAAARGA